eukprot:944056-Prymnesium_polylepis.1
MTWARTPAGPFSEPVLVYSGADQPADDAPATGDTNMACVIFEDGSLAGIWRGDRKVAHHADPDYQYQYRVSARDWRDPSSYAWGEALAPFNIFPSLVGPNDTRNCGIEDPTLWVDASGVLHALVHNWRAGGHAASADRGKTWRWYGGACSSSRGSGSLDWTRSAWPAEVAFSDGSRVTPHRRERPHAVLGADGVLAALTTGVQMDYAPDRTWTLLQLANVG